MKDFTFLQKLKKPRWIGLLTMFLCLQYGVITAQCDPDLTPPTIVCPSDITANATLGNCTVILFLPLATADDACGAVTVFDGGELVFPLGMTIVTNTATDVALNTATCTLTVTVNGGIPSSITCKQDHYKIADADGFTTITPEDIILGVSDFACTNLLLSVGISGAKQSTLELAGLGDFDIYCWAELLGGGYISCETTLSLLASAPATSSFHFPAWRYESDTVTDSIQVNSMGMEFWESFYQEQHVIGFCSGKVAKTLRSYTLLDWMSGGGNETTINTMDLNQDGKIGDGFDAQLFGDSLYLMENGVKKQAIAPKAGLYHYAQIIKYPFAPASLNIKGAVFSDDNHNCSFDNSEPRMAGWLVKAIGQPSGAIFWDTTDVNGNYDIGVCIEDTMAEISLDVPFNFGGTCPIIYEIALPISDTVTQDIAVQLQQNCQRLSVDLSTSKIRPCFPGEYAVSYCNLSDVLVTDAKVDVRLDNYLEFVNATMPSISLGGNVYQFAVGDLAAGFCGEFALTFNTNCSTPTGVVHCSEANITPVSVCDNGLNWAGAWLIAKARCDGDTVRLSLENIGQAAMGQALNFVVVEDLIMYMQAPFQLGLSSQQEIAIKAEGATYHIQSPQVPGHPFGGVVVAQIEGCGGLNLPGASLVLPVGSNNPFQAIDCLANVSSNNANYQTAVPVGFGTQHLIEKNTDIEYTIHFQNIGTDTAINIQILVPLPAELNAGEVTPGAGSNAFDYDVLSGNILRFRFDGIQLADSASNFAAAQGFVSYRIKQQPDLPDGSIILNQAQVSFDGQTPVLTEFISHKIGSNFIMVETDEPAHLAGELEIYPNPGVGMVNFEMKEGVSNAKFTLRDPLGKLILDANFTGNRFQFERGGLSAGVYFFQLVTDKGGEFSGRIIMRD